MQLYTIHERPGGEDFVVVKDGFCWPALFFTLIWALWCRLWWVALGIAVANGLLGLATRLAGTDELTESALGLALAVIVGLVANDLRRWTLGRRGYDEVAVVAAEDADAALHRYLDHRPRPAPSPLPPSAPAAPQADETPPQTPPPAHTPPTPTPGPAL
jgi:hypothetical protein